MTGVHYVDLTILLTACGQLVLQWQTGGQELPGGSIHEQLFLIGQLLNPWIVSGLVATFPGFLCRVRFADKSVGLT